MTYEIIQEKNGEVKLILQGIGEVEAFELGQLDAKLHNAEISHCTSYCNPPSLKIILKERPESEG